MVADDRNYGDLESWGAWLTRLTGDLRRPAI